MPDTPPSSIPLFRAEHVGSLLRPRRLTQAHRALDKGDISRDEYGAVVDESIHEAIALQEATGLKVVTDGEFRRGSYWGHFVEAVAGMGTGPALFDFHDAAGHAQPFIAPHIEGRISRARSISGDEFRFLMSATTRTPKLTLPSPPTMHFWRGPEGLTPNAYDTLCEAFADLARVYVEEIADLGAAGCRYVQIDEVPLAMLCDPGVREVVRRRGDDPGTLVDLYINAINAAVKHRPAGMTVGLHMCRGNFKGKWLAEGGYETVAERAFAELMVDVFFLEYDSPRAGDFAPLRFIPENKGVVLGLVSSKTPLLEGKDELVRRIDDANRVMPLERLALSPQCGFASTVSGNPLTIDDERRKLERIVEVAREVWGHA